MKEKEIKEIILNSRNPEKEIADNFANMRTSLIFVVCIALFGWFLYSLSVNHDQQQIEAQYKEQIFKRDSVNIHNKIVHEQDSITIFDLSDNSFQ